MKRISLALGSTFNSLSDSHRGRRVGVEPGPYELSILYQILTPEGVSSQA